MRRWSVLLTLLVAWGVASAPALAEPFCVNCQQPVAGRYVQIGEQSFHPEHFVCGICDRPLVGTYNLYQGKFYHPECFGQSARCDACGALGLKQGYQSNDDGDLFCPSCAVTLVWSEADAWAHLEAVRQWLDRIGIAVPPGSFSMRLEARKALDDRASKSGISRTVLGLTRDGYDFKIGHASRREKTVYLVQGMSLETFREVAAHELMHVWFRQNTSGRLPPALEEGSCTYVGFLQLQALGTPSAQRQMQRLLANPDEAYGQGFRRIKAYADRRGLGDLLITLRHKKEFPLGY